MNDNKNGEGNTEIPEVEELVIEEGDDAETIASKVKEHNEKFIEYKTKTGEKNSQLYARTKKAEGFELVGDKWVKPLTKEEKESKETSKNSKGGLTSEDVFVLVKADIPQEDIDDVADFAKFKNITIAEALKTSTVKTILADKAEQRKVAEGSNTSGGRRSNARLSDEALLANARKGVFPESAEDISRLTILARAKK